MTRRFLLAAAVGAAALAIPAPAATAGHICVKVTVTGIVNHTVAPPCLSIGPGTYCDTFFGGFPPPAAVSITVCWPNPLPPERG